MQKIQLTQSFSHLFTPCNGMVLWLLFSILTVNVNALFASDKPAAEAPIILVMGDSLSMGHGLPYQHGWVHLLQKRLEQQKFPHKIVNASIGGDTTASGLQRLSAAMKRYHPAIVVIELGGNDGLRGLSLKQTESNLNQMIKYSKKLSSRVLLLGIQLPPNYGPRYNNAFKSIYKRLAKKHRVAWVPFLLKGIGGNAQLMQADGIHPNEKAQAMVVDNVWPTLLELLKPKTIKPKKVKEETVKSETIKPIKAKIVKSETMKPKAAKPKSH